MLVLIQEQMGRKNNCSLSECLLRFISKKLLKIWFCFKTTMAYRSFTEGFDGNKH